MAKHGNPSKLGATLKPLPLHRLQGAIHLWPAGGDSHRQGQNFRNFNEKSLH